MTKDDFEVVHIPCFKWKVHVDYGDEVFEDWFTVGQLRELKDFLKVHKFPYVPGFFAILGTLEGFSSDCCISITYDEIIYTILGGVL